MPLILYRRPRAALTLSTVLLLLFGVASVSAGLTALLSRETALVELPGLFPDTRLTLGVDPLSGFFLFLIGTLVVAVSLYSIGYLRPHAEEAGGPRLAACTAAFVLAMAVVVTASNTLLFLVAWETMSLASYGLVVHHHHSRGAQRAGFIYLVMTHVGTAFLLAAFLIVSAAGSDPFAFETFRAGAAGLTGAARSALFACLLVGFGTKAGIVPLHIWLPRAHPEAPSHASALMSGVMIKVAIYGLVRFAMDLLGPGPAAWGGVVLALGAVSAVVGVLYALMEHDLKRLLAFHSVENIGIILMGVGASMLFASQGRPALAALGLGAGLFHTFNHAVFKGLLFLGAGALQQATGTKNIEAYGGLIHRMPWTAGFFLVGCLSISGLPPFNGFASEWLTYQALLGGFADSGLAARFLLPVVAVALALTGGLAAACFVKAFGVSFLARPRSPRAEAAREPGRSLLVGMGLLAAICVVAGVGPGLVLSLLGSVTAQVSGVRIDAIVGGGPAPTLSAGLGTLSPALLTAGLILFAVAAAAGARAMRPGRRETVGPTWGCGIDLDARMEYSATGFGQPIRQFFRVFYRPKERLHVEHAAGGFFLSRIMYHAHVIRFAEHVIYKPVYRWLVALARRTQAIQSGSLHLYLLYVLITAVVLLLWVA